MIDDSVVASFIYPGKMFEAGVLSGMLLGMTVIPVTWIVAGGITSLLFRKKI